MFDSHVPDHNRYLKGLFSQISDEGLTDELFNALKIELKYANLENTSFDNDPFHLKKDGKYYLALYTNTEEREMDFPDPFGLCSFSFDWFLQYFNAPVRAFIDDDTREMYVDEDCGYSSGIVINPATDKFIIEGKTLKRLQKFFGVELYSYSEIEEKFESIDNRQLDALLNQNPPDWDEIIMRMGSATLLSTVTPEKVQGVSEIVYFINSLNINPLISKPRQEIYTSRDFTTGDGEYVTLVSLMEVVEVVLNFGLSGISVITPDGETFMSRQLLIEKHDFIQEHGNDEKLKKAYNFLFTL